MAHQDEDRDATALSAAGTGLTSVEGAVLELEREFYKYPGAKDATIHDRFGWTPTRYYQILNTLIDTPAALAADPVTVNRLRRIRDQRQRQRSAPTSGSDG